MPADKYFNKYSFKQKTWNSAKSIGFLSNEVTLWSGPLNDMGIIWFTKYVLLSI